MAVLEAEAEVLIDQMLAATAEISANIKAMRQESEVWCAYMDERKKVRDEILRSFSVHGF